MNKICSVENCKKESHARSLCLMHYKRVLNHGDTELRRAKHGQTRLPEYTVWADMKKRCINKKTHAYPNYGGRGITVCKEWLYSFSVFLKDMGERPTKKHQIDRIDNNKGYYKENCRWVTSAENCQNRRSTKSTKDITISIRINKQNLSTKQLSEKYSLSKYIVNRILTNKTWKNV